MKEFIQYLLENIVDDPKKIKIEESTDEKGPCLLVELAEEDKPLVIGKGGRNIKAIRQVASILGKKEGENYYIKIID